MKDSQHRHWDTEKNSTEWRAGHHTSPPRRFQAAPTWVCCRYDGAKKEAVGEVEISAKLPHSFHEPHKAVHDQPEEIKGVRGEDPLGLLPEPARNPPDDEAGGQGSHEGVGQDGADVPEEVSLTDGETERRSTTRPGVTAGISFNWVTRFRL